MRSGNVFLFRSRSGGSWRLASTSAEAGPVPRFGAALFTGLLGVGFLVAFREVFFLAGRPPPLFGSGRAKLASKVPPTVRVCGGTVGCTFAYLTGMGLSPRGRGNPLRPLVRGLIVGSIPAWAGEPPEVSALRAIAAVYPRVGGGTVVESLQESFQYGLSPRGRGNLDHGPLGDSRGRSIPAWAGEPAGIDSSRGEQGVYPRVGGGTGIPVPTLIGSPGLSPRGRGNR